MTIEEAIENLEIAKHNCDEEHIHKYTRIIEWLKELKRLRKERKNYNSYLSGIFRTCNLLRNENNFLKPMLKSAMKYIKVIDYGIPSLMEKLARLDPSDVPIERRLAGVVHTTLKITSYETESLKLVKKAEASKLIEQLKRYIRNAEKKAKNK